MPKSSSKVRLLIDSAPWRYMIPMQTVQLRSKTVQTFVSMQVLERPFMQDMCNLLQEGLSYKLQIEDDNGFYSEPYVTAELKMKSSSAMGCEMQFQFLQELPLVF